MRIHRYLPDNKPSLTTMEILDNLRYCSDRHLDEHDLQRYSAGDMTAREWAHFEYHLNECPICAGFVRDWMAKRKPGIVAEPLVPGVPD